MVSATSARGREEGTQGAAAILKEKNVQCCLETQHQWILFNGNLKNWVWTLRRDTPEILRMQLVQKWILERKWQSGGIIWGCELHERNLCAPSSEEQPPEETSRQADWTSKAAWNLARNFLSSSPRTKLRFILLWRRQRDSMFIVHPGASMHNVEQGDLSWDTMDILRRSETTMCDFPRPGDSANQRVNTSFRSWSRSVRNSAINRWNASDSVASWALLKTRIFIWVENVETPQSTPNGKTIICIMDNPVPLVVPVLSSSSSSSSASTSGPKDQSNSSGESETSSDAVATRSAKLVCGKPWTSTKKHEMHTWAPTQGILVWWQPITVHLVDLEAFVPAQYSERMNSYSEGDASKEETHKRKHSVHAYCRKKPKEIYSAIRKVWWLDNSRAENLQRRTWISEQPPIRCRGTRSRHSVESVSNRKLHRRRRRIYESLQ